jgi:creatinine amidohydrolase/Fe(II)-dependent formamide hydrolase-like protein
MGTSATSRIEQDTLPQPTLSLAFELGQNTWKLGFTIGVAVSGHGGTKGQTSPTWRAKPTVPPSRWGRQSLRLI